MLIFCVRNARFHQKGERFGTEGVCVVIFAHITHQLYLLYLQFADQLNLNIIFTCSFYVAVCAYQKHLSTLCSTITVLLPDIFAEDLCHVVAGTSFIVF